MRHHLIPLAMSSIILLAGAMPQPAQAQDKTLDIELNKIEDSEGRCSAAFVMQNRTGEILDQLRLDLYVFDKAGVIARHLVLDTGPLRNDKTSVARFGISDQPCAEIGRLLINDVPICKSRSGNAVDCITALNPTSRAGVELTK
jgi:hypothetical protein